MTNQQAPEALTDFEHRHAIRQGYEIAASDGYFEARPQIDSSDRRKAFQAGFERGWDRHAALVDAQQPAPSAAAAITDTEAFQNFHRLLCVRFGYVHDERDWRRDQLSLVEHIARQAQPSPTPQADSQSAPMGQNESAYQRGYMDGMAKGRREAEADSQPAPSIDDLCARIKAADDAAADKDYMLDSNDCIAVLRGQWKGPMAMDKPDRAARATADSVTAPATDSYVQPVPDKCDRIVWRGHYYHLPPTAQAADSVTAPAGEVVGYRISDPGEPDLGHWLSEEPGAAWCVSEPLALATHTQPAHATKAGNQQEARPCHVFTVRKAGGLTEWEPTSMAFALPDGAHALYTLPQPTPPAQAADSALEDAALLERERICAAIKAEDDYCVDHGDYMLDSDDCIKIVRGEWVRPDFSVDAARKQGGANGW